MCTRIAASRDPGGSRGSWGSPRANLTFCKFRRSVRDRKSTRLNSSHSQISYAVFCLKKKKLPAEPVIGPTPLLDFFKRGDVSRDVRLEAAEGTLAPRAYEQLAILILLLEDPDAEIRATAEETLSKIPEEVLKTFLARADVPIDMREFFADRGIFPDEMPEITIDEEEPLLDASSSEDAALLGDENDDRETATQRLAKMSFSERLKAAVKGSREMRTILIRDPNKMISSAVLSSPKLAEPEGEAFAKMANVSEDILRIIASNRAWM